MNKKNIVCLAWATKKRHIVINGEILCQPKHKTSGYSYKNGQYNSISLSGIPTYKKTDDDQKFTHTDGIIEFKQLDHQKVKINTRSICKKCLSKYERILK